MLLILLLATCWGATWVLGGAGRVAPHWFYVPILVAASRLGRVGAFTCAILSGILAGPLMPQDVGAGIPQATSDWSSRAIFFVVIGFLMSVVVARHKAAERARGEREAELETLRAIDLSVLGVASFEESMAIARPALDKLVWADRLGIVLRNSEPGKVQRFWVDTRGDQHQSEMPEPRGGPLARALRQPEPFSDLVHPERSEWERELADEGLRSFLLVPFAAEGDVLGALGISSRREGQFPESEIATASRIGTQLTVALRAGAMRKEIERRVAELDAIGRVSEAAGASLEIGKVLDEAIESSLEVTGFQLGWVSLRDGASPAFVLASQRNLPEAVRASVSRFELDGSLLGKVVEEGGPRFLRDVAFETDQSDRDQTIGTPTVSVIAVPLWWEEQVIGLIVLGTLDSRIPSAEDFRLVVSLARPIAAALGNAGLHLVTRQLEEQRSRLLTQLVNAQEEERKRVAVDLHDDAVQVMAAVAMRLDLIRELTGDPSQSEAIEKASLSAREAVTRLRHMLFELHPPSLEREGLEATIRLSLRDIEEDAGVRAVMEGGLEGEPDPDIRVVLYRIAREALTNVRKHAQATHVVVRLDERDEGYHVEVSDNGQGFDPEPLVHEPGHLGLMAMRERAEVAGGWCSVRSSPGAGTSVEAWLPGEGAGAGAQAQDSPLTSLDQKGSGRREHSGNDLVELGSDPSR
ncbi:MAG: GAF domain-containing protein [Actinomycetota bacterium]